MIFNVRYQSASRSSRTAACGFWSYLNEILPFGYFLRWEPRKISRRIMHFLSVSQQAASVLDVAQSQERSQERSQESVQWHVISMLTAIIPSYRAALGWRAIWQKYQSTIDPPRHHTQRCLTRCREYSRVTLRINSIKKKIIKIGYVIYIMYRSVQYFGVCL